MTDDSTLEYAYYLFVVSNAFSWGIAFVFWYKQNMRFPVMRHARF